MHVSRGIVDYKHHVHVDGAVLAMMQQGTGTLTETTSYLVRHVGEYKVCRTARDNVKESLEHAIC